MRQQITQNNNESRIRKVLFNEVTLIISLVAIVIGVVLFIMGPDTQLRQDIELIKKDISTIKDNELVHISKKIEENFEKATNNEKCVNDINIKLERIITLLEQMGY